MDPGGLLLIALVIMAAALYILLCDRLSKRPYKRIRIKKTDNRPLNATYVCDDYCPQDKKICCRSCAHKKYCKDTCEDYYGPCDTRRLYNGED